MKKTVKLMGMAIMLGAVAFFGSSCKKNTPTTKFSLSLPAVETISIDEDKAYIDFNDGGVMKWSEGDQIMAYNLAENSSESVYEVYTITNGVDGQFGDFVGGDLGEEKDWGYYAFYPASKVVRHPLENGNRQTFDVPMFQTYSATGVDPTSLVMAAHDEGIPGGHYEMKHVFGFIDMKLKGTKAVRNIVIRDNFFNLNGYIAANLPYVNESTLSDLIAQCANPDIPFDNYMNALNEYLNGDLGYEGHGGSDGKVMCLECNGVQLNASAYTDFYITLRPGALAKGFVVEVTYTDGNTEVIKKFNPNDAAWGYAAYPKYPRAFCVRPGKIVSFKATLP